MIQRNIFKFAGAEELILSLEKPKRFIDILHETKLTSSTLDRRINDMLGNGLIERKYDPTDRSEKYQLTPEGRKHFHFLLSVDTFGEMFEFSMGESSVGEIIGKIVQFWKEASDKTKALESAKEIIINKITPEVAKAFKEVKKEISEDDIKDILEKTWDRILELWKER